MEGVNVEMKREEEGISMLKTLEAISKLKKKKAAGPDEIGNEARIYGRDKLIGKFRDIVNDIWKNGKISDEWRKGDICPIYKKGDKKKRKIIGV